MSTYMRSLGNTAVLGRQQEARLASILQKGLALEAMAARLAGGSSSSSGPGPDCTRSDDWGSSEASAATSAAAVARVDLAELAAAAGLRSAADAAQVLLNRREAKDLMMQYNVR